MPQPVETAKTASRKDPIGYVYNCPQNGYRVILATPERNTAVAPDTELGFLQTQMSAERDEEGNRPKRFISPKFLDKELISFARGVLYHTITGEYFPFCHVPEIADLRIREGTRVEGPNNPGIEARLRERLGELREQGLLREKGNQRVLHDRHGKQIDDVRLLWNSGDGRWEFQSAQRLDDSPAMRFETAVKLAVFILRDKLTSAVYPNLYLPELAMPGEIEIASADPAASPLARTSSGPAAAAAGDAARAAALTPPSAKELTAWHLAEVRRLTENGVLSPPVKAAILGVLTLADLELREVRAKAPVDTAAIDLRAALEQLQAKLSDERKALDHNTAAAKHELRAFLDSEARALAETQKHVIAAQSAAEKDRAELAVERAQLAEMRNQAERDLESASDLVESERRSIEESRAELSRQAQALKEGRDDEVNRAMAAYGRKSQEYDGALARIRELEAQLAERGEMPAPAETPAAPTVTPSGRTLPPRSGQRPWSKQ